MDKKDELAGQLSQKASILSVLKELVDHPGWKVHNEILNSQMDLRKGEILLKPLQSTEAVYAQEFSKGEISGLALAQISVHAQIETLRYEIQAATIHLENYNEMEARKADDAGRSRVDGDTFVE